MKRLLLAACFSLPVLAGCVSSNSAEGRQSEAYARCSYTPGPKERAACIKTELALIEARERRENDKVAADREAAEQRQSQLEAQGVPRDKAKQVYDSGLRLPDDN